MSLDEPILLVLTTIKANKNGVKIIYENALLNVKIESMIEKEDAKHYSYGDLCKIKILEGMTNIKPKFQDLGNTFKAGGKRS